MTALPVDGGRRLVLLVESVRYGPKSHGKSWRLGFACGIGPLRTKVTCEILAAAAETGDDPVGGPVAGPVGDPVRFCLWNRSATHQTHMRNPGGRVSHVDRVA